MASGSRLWKVPLNTSSVRQRVTLGVLLTVPGLVTVAAVAWQLVSAVPLSFHTDGMYTYDYDQYDHVARALLDGHAWLDLDVPDALRDADNPYDVTTRQQLLADGVSPVYWDYAFFDGRWYSYFGVVPALLLFVPYRAITSLWVDGGLMMPSGAAVPLLMVCFLVFACLLTIRVIERVRPHVSLGCGQYVVRVCGFGVERPVLVVSDEFLFGADCGVLVVEHVGLMAMDGCGAPERGRCRWRWWCEYGRIVVAASFGCRFGVYCRECGLPSVVCGGGVCRVPVVLAADSCDCGAVACHRVWFRRAWACAHRVACVAHAFGRAGARIGCGGALVRL